MSAAAEHFAYSAHVTTAALHGEPLFFACAACEGGFLRVFDGRKSQVWLDLKQLTNGLRTKNLCVL